MQPPPAWFRALQIGSGIISLTLSIILLLVVGYSVLAENTHMLYKNNKAMF